MPVQRIHTPGPNRMEPYMSPLLLDQVAPERPISPENPPPRRRTRGRPAGRRADRTQKIEELYQHISEAIEAKHLTPPSLHKHLSNHDNETMIVMAAENLNIMQQMAMIQEVRNLFTVGYGLDIKMENELPYGHISWSDIGERLQVNKRHIRLGQRIFQLFRYWPEAIYHLNNVHVSNIDKLTDEETQVLTLRLMMSQPTDQEHPLGLGMIN